MDRRCLICNKRYQTYPGLTKHITSCTAKNELPVFDSLFTFNQASNCDLQTSEKGFLKRVVSEDYHIDNEFDVHLGTVDGALNSWATVKDDFPASNLVVGQTQST